MASTVTNTRTVTKTFARITLLTMQCRAALRQTTDIDDVALERLMEGVEKQWLRKFSIYALDRERLCRAELTLEIDWDKYNFQISIGKATISIDEKWKDNTAIEVDEAVRAFKNFVREFSLSTKWVVWYTDNICDDPKKLKEVRKRLGLVSAKSVK